MSAFFLGRLGIVNHPLLVVAPCDTKPAAQMSEDM